MLSARLAPLLAALLVLSFAPKAKAQEDFATDLARKRRFHGWVAAPYRDGRAGAVSRWLVVLQAGNS